MNTRLRLTTFVAGAAAALALPLGAFGHTTVSPNFAGTGDSGFEGDGGPAPEADLDGPRSIATAPDGDGYLIADTANNRIRKVAADGTITTVVGEGSGSFNGDGLSALSTKLYEPRGVTATSDGALLIADTENHRIRKVAPGFGSVTTVVGNGNEGGLLSSLLGALLGTDAELDHPSAVAARPDGSFLIADTENNVIRNVDADGNMTTVAGDGSGNYSGDGGAATSAQLCNPEDVALTEDGGFLIADTGNHVVRQVDANGTITTVAGNGSDGYSGDDGVPTGAELSGPKGVEVLDGGGFLIADTGNDAIRRVKDDVIKTKAGGSMVQATSDEDADQLDSPTDVLSVADAMLVADAGGNRVHLVGSLTGERPEEDDKAPILPPVVVDGKPDDGGKRDDGRKDLLPPPDAPTVAEDLNVARTEGSVRIRLPGTAEYVVLERDASIPFGSIVDARRGTVTLTTARNGRGVTQSAAFRGSYFKVTQRRSRKPVTDLRLRGGNFDSCGRQARKAGMATIAAKRRGRRGRGGRRARRKLWGRGHGRFRTIGRHGAATVRGTIWMTADRCDGTLVRVRRGRVEVRDFRARKTVFVGAGQSYFARINKRHVRRR